MQDILHLFNLIVQNWYTDTDLIDEDNKDVWIAFLKIMRKYKTHDSRVKHMIKDLVDRNYIHYEEDVIWCREFLRWYFIWKSEK